MPHKPYSSRIRELAEKWTNGTISETERQEFIDWYNQFDDQELIMPPGSARHAGGLKNEMLRSIQQSIRPTRQRTYPWRRVAVAAAILLVIFTGSYFLFFTEFHKSGQPVSAAHIKDVKAPSASRAVITLADGSKVYLDSAGSGQLARQGNTMLVKLAGGQIAYQPAADDPNAALSYNTLTNPRGSKAINMTLADGSRVWLNAGSSITYPVAFKGNERRVSMTGEAYFEVSHQDTENGAWEGDAQRIPFIVEKGDMHVTVLGTKFNVNAYDNEQDIRVTLLEGSVRASGESAGKSALLKPGQQARIAKDISVAGNVDLEQIMAWKNGLFKFNDEELTTIMKQIERWYNVEVEYKGKFRTLNFGGVMSRKENVSAVLDLLELTGVAAFDIAPSAEADAKIIVTIK